MLLVAKMEIQLKLYGVSKILSNKDTLNIKLPNNSDIRKLIDIFRLAAGFSLFGTVTNIPILAPQHFCSQKFCFFFKHFTK